MNNLKEKLKQHYQENAADFDPEETENVLEILDEIEESDLSDASRLSLELLQRMVNNDDEIDEALEILVDNLRVEDLNNDPFDEF